MCMHERVCVCLCVNLYVEARGQSVGVCFLFPPFGSWILSSGRQAERQVPLPLSSILSLNTMTKNGFGTKGFI